MTGAGALKRAAPRPRRAAPHLLSHAAGPPAQPAPGPMGPDAFGALGVGDNGLQAQDMRDIEGGRPVRRVSRALNHPRFR